MKKVLIGLAIFLALAFIAFFLVVYDYRFEKVHLETLSNYNDIVLFGFNWALKG